MHQSRKVMMPTAIAAVQKKPIPQHPRLLPLPQNKQQLQLPQKHKLQLPQKHKLQLPQKHKLLQPRNKPLLQQNKLANPMPPKPQASHQKSIVTRITKLQLTMMTLLLVLSPLRAVTLLVSFVNQVDVPTSEANSPHLLILDAINLD